MKRGDWMVGILGVRKDSTMGIMEGNRDHQFRKEVGWERDRRGMDSHRDCRQIVEHMRGFVERETRYRRVSFKRSWYKG